jgi:hypothetical protein
MHLLLAFEKAGFCVHLSLKVVFLPSDTIGKRTEKGIHHGFGQQAAGRSSPTVKTGGS